MSYIASWSGGLPPRLASRDAEAGKDSCLACYKAMLNGYQINGLVNFVSKEYGRVSFHGTETKLIQLQAESIGMRLWQQVTTADGYEQEFKEAIRRLIPEGIEGMVFGDTHCAD
jgi:diphthamide synthase (EF-2-diphthine--ammonia ligase)